MAEGREVNEVVRESEVSRALSVLDKSVEVLSISFSELRDVLDPALRPIPPSPGGAGGNADKVGLDPEFSTPLAIKINNVARMVQSVTANIATTTNRVEL